MFACITVTKHVFSSIASITSSALTNPSSSTPTNAYVNSPNAAFAFKCSITAGCSIAVATIFGNPRPGFFFKNPRTAPSMAKLSLSLPHEVNVTSSLAHPNIRAVASRAASIASRHGVANACPDDGFPKCSYRNGAMARETSGHMGVVAL